MKSPEAEYEDYVQSQMQKTIEWQSARIAALEAALIGILGQIDAGHRFDGCAHMRESCPRCLAEKKAEEVLNG